MKHGVYFTKKELFLVWNLLLDRQDDQKIKIFCYPFLNINYFLRNKYYKIDFYLIILKIQWEIYIIF